MNTTLPAPLVADPADEIAGLIARYRRANGPVMLAMTRLGGAIETQLAVLPQGARSQIDKAVMRGLEQAFRVSGVRGYGPNLGSKLAPALVAMTGAVGGFGGLATAIPEIPVTITLMLHAIRQAAIAEGFDPDAPAIRDECLRVFASGSPAARDDGVNTAFLGARLTLTGPTVQNLIRMVVPRLALVFGQKMALQAVPVLGAISGAALNAAFLSYYRELAHIRFALLRLTQQHGAERVLLPFRQAVEPALAAR